MTQSPIQLDVLIVGGGIAGLWTLARLRSIGHAAILIERTALGTGQTIASQGIIHGGVKYALSGSASKASAAIAPMPDLWRACLDGTGEVDLTEARVRSQHCILFTTGSVGSRLMALAASKAIRSKPKRLNRSAFPPVLADAPRSVDVYAVDEPVLDVASVLATLRAQTLDALALVQNDPALSIHDATIHATLTGPDRSVELIADRVVLCAGAGNAALLDMLETGDQDLGLGAIRMQRRPLHMVMARGDLPEFAGHCVGAALVPHATITSARDGAGRVVWTIGGRVAESGNEHTSGEQIAAARAELAGLMPWIDLTNIEFATFRVDRAEGLTADGDRPDEPVVRRAGPVIACWPTKFAFAPTVAAQVLDLVGPPRVGNTDQKTTIDWPRPGVASLPWEGATWQ